MNTPVQRRFSTESNRCSHVSYESLPDRAQHELCLLIARTFVACATTQRLPCCRNDSTKNGLGQFNQTRVFEDGPIGGVIPTHLPPFKHFHFLAASVHACTIKGAAAPDRRHVLERRTVERDPELPG